MNIDETHIKFETFVPTKRHNIRSFINGVRAIHIPTSMIGESYELNTHNENKLKALELLKEKLKYKE